MFLNYTFITCTARFTGGVLLPVQGWFLYHCSPLHPSCMLTLLQQLSSCLELAQRLKSISSLKKTIKSKLSLDQSFVMDTSFLPFRILCYNWLSHSNIFGDQWLLMAMRDVKPGADNRIVHNPGRVGPCPVDMLIRIPELLIFWENLEIWIWSKIF